MDIGRTAHEREHGKKLAQENPGVTWGWDTAAGKERAMRRAQLIIAGAQLSSSIRVLEIGCGTGIFTVRFAQTGAQIVAVDISEDLIAIAQTRQLPEKQVRFIAKPFEECDVEGPFDAIIGSSVLHHLDVEKALTKMFTLLKPCGRISFTEPNMLNPQIALQKNIPWLKKLSGDSPDETAFIRWKLKRVVSNAGFANISLTPFDWLHPAIPGTAINLVSRIGQTLESLPLIREFSGSIYICAQKPA